MSEEGYSIDKSQYYDLIKEIQSEVKEKVISKLLDQVQRQEKELSEFKKENALLKNQLTYVLKRVILSKSDFNSTIKKNRINNVSSTIYKNNSMIINERKGSNKNVLRPLRSCENYRCVTEGNIFNSGKKNGSTSNLNGGTDFNYNADNKVSGYLNSLYRHNFSNNNNNQFLNKKESLYDELFANKNNSYLLTEEDKSQKKNVNNSVDKRVNNANKSQTLRLRNNKYDYRTYKGKGSVKKKINYNVNGGDNGQKYSKAKFSSNNSNVKKARLVNYPKRSPFIANKF